jgi:hypothetical protein
MGQAVNAFTREYAFAYRWLIQHCPPWGWLAGALLLPGTPARAAVMALPTAALSVEVTTI